MLVAAAEGHERVGGVMVVEHRVGIGGKLQSGLWGLRQLAINTSKMLLDVLASVG
jgi:hypothetical protein